MSMPEMITVFPASVGTQTSSITQFKLNSKPLKCILWIICKIKNVQNPDNCICENV